MFIEDANIDFPKYPVFLKDILIYEIPHGTGILFQGAVLPLILHGNKAKTIIEYLRKELTGKNSIDNIFKNKPLAISDENMLFTIRKLYSHGLIRHKEENPNSYSITEKEIVYWGRKFNSTGFLKSEYELLKAIKNKRILVIGNDLILETFVDLLLKYPFQNIGLIEISTKKGTFIEKLCKEQKNIKMYIKSNSNKIADILKTQIRYYSLVVVCIRNINKNILNKINILCHEFDIQWIPVYEDGVKFEIGPCITPFKSSCYNCLTLRKRNQMEMGLINYVIESENNFRGSDSILIGEDFAANYYVASFVIGEIIKIISGYAHSKLYNTYYEFNPVETELNENIIYQVPRCPICSLQ